MKIVNLTINVCVVFILVTGCNQAEKSSEDSNEEIQKITIEDGTVLFKANDYKDEDIVFYNLFSPVELTYLVTKKESYYNSSLINPINNITKYNESAKVALNMGVYGADITYLWMFDQSQQALSYRAAIVRLTDQLSIPRDYVNFTYESAESNAQNFDSLVYIAKVAYKKTDNYLKETGRNHSSSLILLGGWIETLYIATHMYDEPSSKLLGKIAIQKFSLNSLISLLQLSQDEINVSEYLLLLKRLRKAYDRIEIQFPPESLVIDTSMKHIKLNNAEMLNLKAEDFTEVSKITKQIRDHIIR